MFQIRLIPYSGDVLNLPQNRSSSVLPILRNAFWAVRGKKNGSEEKIIPYLFNRKNVRLEPLRKNAKKILTVHSNIFCIFFVRSSFRFGVPKMRTYRRYDHFCGVALKRRNLAHRYGQIGGSKNVLTGRRNVGVGPRSRRGPFRSKKIKRPGPKPSFR